MMITVRVRKKEVNQMMLKVRKKKSGYDVRVVGMAVDSIDEVMSNEMNDL